ncbi:hypothetical protein Tco_0687464 [Tanacetum coccineum]
MANESASTTTGVGSTSALTIREIIPTNRTPEVLKDFNMCIMTNGQKKAQCKYCFHFFSEGSNTTLKNHITHPHCEVLKAQQNQNPEAGQTSMGRDGQIFMYNPDYLREQFAGLVIQRGLPFNHFDHEGVPEHYATKIHSWSNLTTMELEFSSDGFATGHWIGFTNLFKDIKKKARNDPTLSSEFEQIISKRILFNLHPKDFAILMYLGFAKARVKIISVLSRMAMGYIKLSKFFGSF